MRRFGLIMDDYTYSEFYRMFPDHGQRTNVLRKCVKRMIEKAKVTGGVLPGDIENTADKIIKEEEGGNW